MKIKIYKIYNFFLWCTLRRIFGPEGEDVTEEWIKLCCQELCNFFKYGKNDKIKEDKMGQDVNVLWGRM